MFNETDRPKRLAHEYSHESFGSSVYVGGTVQSWKQIWFPIEIIRFTSFRVECPPTNDILVTSFEMNGKVGQHRNEKKNCWSFPCDCKIKSFDWINYLLSLVGMNLHKPQFASKYRVASAEHTRAVCVDLSDSTKCSACDFV